MVTGSSYQYQVRLDATETSWSYRAPGSVTVLPLQRWTRKRRSVAMDKQQLTTVQQQRNFEGKACAARGDANGTAGVYTDKQPSASRRFVCISCHGLIISKSLRPGIYTGVFAQARTGGLRIAGVFVTVLTNWPP